MSAGRWLAVVAFAVGLIVVAATYADRSPPPPLGTVLWKADAELPAPLEWASSRAESAGGAGCDDSPAHADSPRIERSTSVVAQGRASYGITAEAGDECDGERAELAQGNPTAPAFEDRLFNEGDDRYISFQLYLARNFDVNVDAWRVVAQLHQAGGYGGPPPLSLDVERGRFVLYRSDSADTDPMWSAPADGGRWVKFTLHVRFSADPDDGLVELWGNPAGGDVVRLLDETASATMKRDESGTPLPDHARIGIYRNPEGPFGTETVYYDGYTVATSRAAAEASAFAPPAQ